MPATIQVIALVRKMAIGPQPLVSASRKPITDAVRTPTTTTSTAEKVMPSDTR